MVPLNNMALKYANIYNPDERDYSDPRVNATTGKYNSYTSPNIKSVSDTDLHTPVGGGGGMPWQMIATIAAQNVGSFFANVNPGIYSLDLLRDAGTSNSQIGGIGFERQNSINRTDILDEYDRKNTSNIWKGNIGGFIGGLLGRSKLEDEIHNAKMQMYRTNTVNQDLALSQSMQNKWYDRHNNTYDQTRPLLADKGIDALAKPGEILGKRSTGDAFTLTGGVPGKDSIKTKVDDDTFILNPAFAQMAKPWVDYQQYLKGLIDLEKTTTNKSIKENVLKKELNRTRDAIVYYADAQKDARDNGDIPVGDNIHASVGWDSLVVNGLTALQGVGDYINAKRSRIKNPYTYVENPYVLSALGSLKKLSISPYPIMTQMHNAETRGRYQIAQSGGLSSSLKMASNVALTANTQNNIAQNLANIQALNNSYTQNWAQSAIQAGALAAQLRLNAAQHDLDYYSKAHAAKQNIMNTSLLNIFGSLRAYVSDRDKLNRFNKMYLLYSDDLNSRT